MSFERLQKTNSVDLHAFVYNNIGSKHPSDFDLKRTVTFWTTVCKTVRPTLSNRCPVCRVCLSCLPVTLVYCGQTIGWIKIKIGT